MPGIFVYIYGSLYNLKSKEEIYSFYFPILYFLHGISARFKDLRIKKRSSSIFIVEFEDQKLIFIVNFKGVPLI